MFDHVSYDPDRDMLVGNASFYGGCKSGPGSPDFARCEDEVKVEYDEHKLSGTVPVTHGVSDKPIADFDGATLTLREWFSNPVGRSKTWV